MPGVGTKQSNDQDLYESVPSAHVLRGNRSAAEPVIRWLVARKAWARKAQRAAGGAGGTVPVLKHVFVEETACELRAESREGTSV